MPAIATKYPFFGTIESRIGGREENQDHAWYIDTPIGLLLVVCDGMGGGPGGRTASHTAVDTILSVLEDVSPKTALQDALFYGIEKANEAIYNMAIKNADLRGMGTTVVAMLINENGAVVAHVGDSRLYQLRESKVVFRTADHSKVAEMVREGLMTEEEARNHPRSNIITRALGIRPVIEIEIDSLTFQAHDRFVLCTDGVWGMIPQEKIIKNLTRPMGLVELTELVVAEIDNKGNKNGGGHDNLTLAILDTQCASEDCSVDSLNAVVDSCNPGLNVNSSVVSSSCRRWTYKHSFWTLLGLVFVVALMVLLPIWEKSYETSSQLVIQEIPAPRIRIERPSQRSFVDPVDTSDLSDTARNSIDITQDVQNVRKGNKISNPLVVEKVDIVIKKLGVLKTVSGKDQKDGRSKKKRYIRDSIMYKLKNIPLNDAFQKQNYEKACEMLNNPMAFDCSKKGKPSKESNEYIDKISNVVCAIKYHDRFPQ